MGQPHNGVVKPALGHGLIVAVVMFLGASCSGRGEEPATEGGIRTWTSTRGQTLRAEFVRMQFGTVYLKSAEGRMMHVSLGKLSHADQKVARSLAAAASTVARSGRSGARTGGLSGPGAGRYEGTYRWGNKPGDLYCVLKAKSAGKLGATFTCKYEGKTHIYKGALKPNGADGQVTGTFTVRKPRDYVLKGKVKDGRFDAAFFLLDEDGKERSAGNFTAEEDT